jgi:3-hydroxymyristoyl/3-hydroxydecanoyl-(acyl carrier protein) dehydratase
LDAVDRPAAAYGLRKLTEYYNGEAIRVRRDSDDEEKDIGFDAMGDLNTKSLMDFVGSGSGYVTTWYDQSGNGRHAVQAEQNNQPMIVNSGSVKTRNGQPTLTFDTQHRFLDNDSFNIDSIVTIFATLYTTTVDNNRRAFVMGNSGFDTNHLMITRGSDSKYWLGYRYPASPTAWPNTKVDGTFTPGVLTNVSYRRPSTTLQEGWINGTAQTSQTNETTTFTATNARIGGWESISRWFGDISEIIVYPSALSDTNRKAIEQSQMAYFGINQPSPTVRPLDAVETTAAAAYGLRKLDSNYTGSAITVRRSMDDKTKDIGFDESGMLKMNEMLEFIGASRPLDLVKNAEAAYGLRQLNSSYAGPGVKVLNDENAELDIRFNRMGALDTGELLAFAKGGNVRVKTWYDQSGKARDAIQEETQNQPLIVIEGRLVTQNNRPAVSFSSSRKNFLNYDGSFLTDTPYSVFMAEARGNDKNSNWVLGGSNPEDLKNLSIGYYNGKTYLTHYNNTLVGNSVTFTSQELFQSSYRTSLAERDIYRNGVLDNSQTEGISLLTENNGAMIGKRVANITSYYDGNISEIILYPEYLDNADRRLVEASQGRYFGVEGLAEGYVTRWYDQSGNNRHAEQGSEGSQPKIVSGGKIEMVNGRPSAYWDGSNDYMIMEYGINPNSVYALINDTSTRNSHRTFLGAKSNVEGSREAYYFKVNDLNGRTEFDMSYTTTNMKVSIPRMNNQLYLYSSNMVDNTGSLYINGQLQGSSSGTGSKYSVDGPTVVGAGYHNNKVVDFYDGHIPEIIIYPSALSDTQRQAVETSQMNFFNLHRAKETEPSVTLNINGSPRQATYLRGSGSQQITFRYTVQPGDHSITEVVVEDQVTSNNATFKNNAGVDVSLWLGDILENANIFIDSGFQVPFRGLAEISNLTLVLDEQIGSVLVTFDSNYGGEIGEKEYTIEIHRKGSMSTVEPPDGAIDEITTIYFSADIRSNIDQDMTNLPGGNYQYKVRVKVEDDEYSEYSEYSNEILARKLGQPTNLRWDGFVARWDQDEDSKDEVGSYWIDLIKDNANGEPEIIEKRWTRNTYYDEFEELISESGLAGNEFRFRVRPVAR